MILHNLPESFGKPFPEAFSFESQKVQYPALGEPGISYFAGETKLGVVDCLLWRDKNGVVLGILNYYSFNALWDDPILMVLSGEEYMESKGNVNLFVDPAHRRHKIASLLLSAAGERWDIDLAQQRYTADGRKFIEWYSEHLGRT